MKLESFKGKKFEALSDDAMAYIVGGYYESSKDKTVGGVTMSNDYVTHSGNSTTYHYADGPGHDWSHTMMVRFCGENYLIAPGGDGNPVPDPTEADEVWAEWQLHAFIVEP